LWGIYIFGLSEATCQVVCLDFVPTKQVVIVNYIAVTNVNRHNNTIQKSIDCSSSVATRDSDR
jgi:hypothetical protein